MATPEEYANWIVQNQDKKGTPEFDTVAEAYRQSKAQPAPELKKVQTAPALGSEPIPSVGNRLLSAGAAALRGAPGGPFGVVGNLAREASSQAQQGADRLAYETGGQVTDIASKAGLSPNVSAGLGYTANVATAALPMFMGGALARVPFDPLGKYFMRSAIKPNVGSVVSGDYAKAERYMFDKGRLATAHGAKDALEDVKTIGNKISTLIKGSGETVPRSMVENEIRRELSGVYGKQLPSPAKNADLDAIKSVLDEVTSKLPDQIPVELAQELKQATHTVLAGKYGELANAAEQAQKAGARGLRIGLEQKFPPLRALNQEQAGALTAAELLGHRSAVNSARVPGGLSWLSHGVPQATGFEMARSSPVLSWLARETYGPHGIPSYLGRTAGGILGSYGSLDSPEEVVTSARQLQDNFNNRVSRYR